MITKNSELKKGDTILWWSGEFQAQLQKFFTRRGKRYYDTKPRTGEKSHSSIVYDVNGDTVRTINVSTTVKLSEININSGAGKWIYRLKDVPQKEIDSAVDYIWHKYKGKIYPLWQWETYPSRWLFEILYEKKYLYYPFGWLWHSLHNFEDVRRWGTLFPQGAVCTEATFWDYYLIVATERIRRYDDRFFRLRKRITEWSSNKFHATDCELITEEFENIYELIFHKQLGE